MIRLLAPRHRRHDSRQPRPSPRRQSRGHRAARSMPASRSRSPPGRRYDFARPIFESLPAPLTLILSNGAIVKTRRRADADARPAAARRGALGARRSVPAASRTVPPSSSTVPREGQVVFEAIDWDHPRHAPLLRGQPAVPARDVSARGVSDRGSDSGDVHRPLRRDARAVRPLRGRSSRGDFSVALTEYQHRDFSLVDVVRAGCSKGSALRAAGGARGASRRRTSWRWATI